MKLDFGTQMNGYIIDSAFTVAFDVDNDVISGNTVLYAKFNPAFIFDAAKGYNNGIDLAISVISEFENKKNHWEFIGDNLFRCKKCGYIADIQWLKEWKQKITDNMLPNFCPNCGERMYGK